MVKTMAIDAALCATPIKQIKYLDGAVIDDDGIRLPISIEAVADLVAAGTCLIVRNVYQPDHLRDLYLNEMKRYEMVEPDFRKNTWGQEDYWRIDDNPPASSIPKIQCLYFNFLWNNVRPEVMAIARNLARLRNQIAGLPADFGFAKGGDWSIFPVIQHYPRGGGNITKHHDPLEPQKCVLSLLMGKDFEEGGLFVEIDGKDVAVEPLLNPGDIFVFRPNIPHGIAPIDPGATLDFRNPGGRWRLASILSESIG